MKQGNYSKLNEKGFAEEETEIVNEDFIIGKVSPIQPTGDNNKVYKDSSEIFKSNVDGVIDRVHTGIYNSEGYEMYNVRVRMERIPVIWDKFCLTPAHEVLTTNGWKNIDKITLGDNVACLNKKEEIYYSKPSKLWKFEHKGKMYKLETEQIDLITTLEHKMYVKKEDRRYFELIEAKNVIGKKLNYKKNGKWIKPDNELNQINKPINEFLNFLGLWYSGNKKELLEARLLNLDLDNYLKSLNNNYNNLPDWVFDLSETQSRILLEAIMSGDTVFFTTSKKLADDITRLALHCGWSANVCMINNTYELHIIKMQNEPLIKSEGSLIDYDGMVYCIEVPNHVFYTRLNMKPCWTGNSNRHG
jgi:hypothetical protein